MDDIDNGIRTQQTWTTSAMVWRHSKDGQESTRHK